RQKSVFAAAFGAGCPRVVDVDARALLLQLAHHFDYLRVSDVGAVLLERDAEHQHAGPFDVDALGRHELGNPPGDVQTHVVVEAPPGEDHLRVIADFLGLVGEVVGVDADAVPTDQARLEVEEVPLAGGRV